MNAIENAAYLSISRASAFAGFAVLIIMLSFSFDLSLAARIGGLCGFAVAAILALYGLRAAARPYYRNEAWIILPEDLRPHPGVAQRVIGQAVRDTALNFARQSATCSAVLLVASVFLKLA